jgi:hypothetical protein
MHLFFCLRWRITLTSLLKVRHLCWRPPHPVNIEEAPTPRHDHGLLTIHTTSWVVLQALRAQVQLPVVQREPAPQQV